MARIRSVHPTLFTDEAWVSCSPLARVLYIGLMTDADDQGLFEWKPLQIRMRLLPGDNADVPALLAELVDANLIAELESGGKRLGAIRYFRRFQRPKKPTAVYLLPPEWANYVGLGEVGSELDDDDGPPVPPDGGTGSELPPQMEDGGRRREDGESLVPRGTSVVDKAQVDAFWSAAPKVARERSSRKDLERALKGAVKRGHDLNRVLLGVEGYYASREATKDDGQFAKGLHRVIEIDRWEAFAPAGHGLLSEAPPADETLAKPTDARQRLWMQDFKATPRDWREHERGPKPGEPGCRVTPEIQREFGIEPAKPQSVDRSAA